MDQNVSASNRQEFTKDMRCNSKWIRRVTSIIVIHIFFLAIVGLPAFAQNPLVGYWPLNEGLGEAIANEVGAYHAKVNGARWEKDGQRGWCMRTGDSGVIEIPVAALSGLGDETTVAFWQLGDREQQRGRFFHGVHGTESRLTGFFEDGQVVFVAGDSRIAHEVESSAYTGSWNHWAFSKDGSNGQMRIYLNGRIWHSVSGQFGSIRGDLFTTFLIGSRADEEREDTEESYSGLISDFRIYADTLTPSQIEDVMNGKDLTESRENKNSADTTSDGPGNGGSGEEDYTPVGLKKQLLVDDYVISQTENVTREMGRVTKENNGKPILMADRPWEHWNRLGFYFGAIYDKHDMKFKIWYLAQHSGWQDLEGRETEYTGVGYAESDDGIQWSKPSTGFKYSDFVKGAPDTVTNTVLYGAHGFSCFIDPTVPQGHPEKYKAALDNEFEVRPDGGSYSRTCMAYSRDGIHWTYYNNGNHVTGRASDTQNQILWDYISRRYILVCREDLAGDVGTGENRGTRVMAHNKGNDILNHPAAWETLSIIDFNREGETELNRRQIHATTVWPYENIYLGFLSAMEFLEDSEDENTGDLHVRHEKNIVNLYLSTSRDAVDWDLDWAYASKPLIPRGPAGSTDKDGVHVPNLITYEDRHWLYYCSMSERFGHNDPKAPMSINLATLRLDGFVCLEAKDRLGTVLTKPFKLEGSALQVNVDAKQGEILVEILGEDGKTIPGFSARNMTNAKGVDDLRFTPHWKNKNDLSELKGRIIRLKFALRNAQLYAFQVQQQ
jgi:hypothetical protein